MPTFSSSQGISGTIVTESTLTFTSTFTTAVTGVTAADFGLVSSASGVTHTTSVATTNNVDWVLTVVITDGFKATDLSVTTLRDSGAISHKNAAGTNNGFYLKCACPARCLCPPPPASVMTVRLTCVSPPRLRSPAAGAHADVVVRLWCHE